jgi:hypothetical protein
MNNCESSNYWYNSSPTKGNTDNIVWNGGDIPCLGICNGVKLTALQTAIANKLCEIVADIDLSTLVIPQSLSTAFAGADDSVLAVIQILLNQYDGQQPGTQQAEIDSINNTLATFNPQITVDYPNCCSSLCLTDNELTISEHFEKVLGCLCTLSNTVSEQTILIGKLRTDLDELTTTVELQQASIDDILEKWGCVLLHTGC